MVAVGAAAAGARFPHQAHDLALRAKSGRFEAGDVHRLINSDAEKDDSKDSHERRRSLVVLQLCLQSLLHLGRGEDFFDWLNVGQIDRGRLAQTVLFLPFCDRKPLK